MPAASLIVTWLGAATAQEAAAPPAARAAVPYPSTLRMVERLDECKAAAVPDQNNFMSRERVAIFTRRTKAAAGTPRETEMRLRLALELIQAGDTLAGIEELDRVEAGLASIPAAMRARMQAQVERWRGVGWLRLGEQENCLDRHCCSSCIAPIEPGGQHAARRGSENAVKAFERILAASPKDDEARWLLNLAHMTLGTWPDGVPEAFRIGRERFASEWDLPRWRDVAGECGVAHSTISGGACIEDFDRDGDLDLLCSSMGWDDPLRYYVSNGDGTFTDRAKEAGIDVLCGGLNCLQADYDNDGFADVLVLRGGWLQDMGRIPNSLLRNRGDGTFEDVTEAAGVLSWHPTQAAVFADFDGDGWLDLAIGNESSRGGRNHPCELYWNQRDGTFREIAAEVGAAHCAMVKGIAAADVDDDGRPELFLSCRAGTDVLLHNRPDPTPGSPGFRFVDITRSAGTIGPEMSFPCWFFDYDNDGREDLFVATNAGFNGGTYDTVGTFMCGRAVEGLEMPKLYRNLGGLRFEDVSAAVRVDRAALTMGSNFGDLDADGWLDLYLGNGGPDLGALLPNVALRNDRGVVFQEVTTTAGLGHLQKGHGVAFGDLDHDGDEDLYEELGGFVSSDFYPAVLFENPTTGRRFITLRLEGVKANRAAIGARVRVDLATPSGPRSLHRTVGTGGSFGSSSLQQEIGLGDATAITAIHVRWPGSGTVQELPGPAMDAVYRLVEGGALEPVAVKPFRLGGGG
ncbi:MAG: CRTAC1 family protein [Planctomycetes bacterium]|nr:CRTAC1 family protein [Planctomycetota bacterium]